MGVFVDESMIQTKYDPSGTFRRVTAARPAETRAREVATRPLSAGKDCWSPGVMIGATSCACHRHGDLDLSHRTRPLFAWPGIAAAHTSFRVPMTNNE
eukprot:scaffold190389_cov31-Tisochrysis_lutea.AAC.3